MYIYIYISLHYYYYINMYYILYVIVSLMYGSRICNTRNSDSQE